LLVKANLLPFRAFSSDEGICRPLLFGDGLGTSGKDTRLACSGTVAAPCVIPA
jgi:hypothetical protein